MERDVNIPEMDEFTKDAIARMEWEGGYVPRENIDDRPDPRAPRVVDRTGQPEGISSKGPMVSEGSMTFQAISGKRR